MKPEEKYKIEKPEGMSQEDFELLSSIAEELSGVDLFPEATAEAKYMLERLVWVGPPDENPFK